MPEHMTKEGWLMQYLNITIAFMNNSSVNKIEIISQSDFLPRLKFSSLTSSKKKRF